jgi:dolichol-phosphate mannosyltransferase
MDSQKNIKDLQNKTSDNVSEFEVDITNDDVTVIIPTLNEEEAIGYVLEDVLTNGYENILIVDGNSTDRTLEIVKKYKVKAIQQEGKGKTGALKTALKHIKTPYFVLMDGDCTYAAKDIEKLFHLMQDNNEAIGHRSSGREHITSFNRLGNWMINVLFNLIFDSKVRDVCSGMYMLSTRFARTLPLNSDGFDIEVELAAHAAHNGSIDETPIDYFQRRGIQKLHPIRDGAKIISRIFLLGLKLKPLRMFTVFEMLLTVPGIILLFTSFRVQMLGRIVSSYSIGLLFIILAIQGYTLYIVDKKYLRKNNH